MSTIRRGTQVREYGWLIGVWVVVALFALVTAVWSVHVGVPLRDPQGVIFQRRLLWALALFGFLIGVDASIRAGSRPWTVEKISAELRRRWPTERLVLALTGLLAYHIVYVCYRNLKSWDAFNRPRDGDMLRLDSWLFLGHTPASLLHDLLGQGLAAHILAAIYVSFTRLVPLAFVSGLVFADRIRDGYVFLMSAMWVWILGTASYYLIPTLGPFASARHVFDGLADTAITKGQIDYLAQRAHLLEDPQAPHAFASISAFASLHVAFTFMVLLMLRYFGLRRAARVLGVYLVGVIIATIYFGWHFVTDDVAGMLLAYLAVLFARRMMYPRGGPAQADSGRQPDVIGGSLRHETERGASGA